jgi:glycerol-3-phosphate dehydrogenase
MSLLDLATLDGRVVSLRPVSRVEADPLPHEGDVRWLLSMRSGAATCSPRGLVAPARRPQGGRGHHRPRAVPCRHCLPHWGITIAGGKWTTYRVMAEDTVDRAVELL